MKLETRALKKEIENFLQHKKAEKSFYRKVVEI